MSSAESESLCPFCAKPNLCGVSAPGGCWCGKVEIPMELIEMLPERGKSCICRNCVDAFHKNPEQFTGFSQTSQP